MRLRSGSLAGSCMLILALGVVVRLLKSRESIFLGGKGVVLGVVHADARFRACRVATAQTRKL
jgi:hypothetical protein